MGIQESPNYKHYYSNTIQVLKLDYFFLTLSYNNYPLGRLLFVGIGLYLCSLTQ